MKLTIDTILKINQGLDALLKERLPVKLSFNLVKNKEQTEAVIKNLVTALNKIREDNLSLDEDELQQVLISAEQELMTEEQEVELIHIHESDLPEELEGTIILNLMPIIIKEDEQ